MDIATEKTSEQLIARLRGRLDAAWSPAVRDALTGYIKAGEHRIRLDMAAVDYISSTGLRVLLSTFKQLKAVNGSFFISPASSSVSDTLTLAGMDMLLVPMRDVENVSARAAVGAQSGQPFADAALRGVVFSLPPGAPISLRLVEAATSLSFSQASFALGVGALGSTDADCEGRRGEFIAAGGCAAYQPTDGANRPDFIVSEGALVPRANLVSGIVGTGAFTRLLRFEPQLDARTVALSSLADAVLKIAGGDAAAFVAVAEVAGLVGAALRRDPCLASAQHTASYFSFPEIRDWLSFTGERSFRETTALLVGVVSKAAGSAGSYSVQLRPLFSAPVAPLGHVHALVVPYRPLQKGMMDLAPMVAALFDGASPQGLLHLLGDPRGACGAGESDFSRGAVWLAPVDLTR